jgi:hypothetical protein
MLDGYPHRKHNDTDAPTIDAVTVSIHVPLNHFGCQIAGSPAHCLME